MRRRQSSGRAQTPRGNILQFVILQVFILFQVRPDRIRTIMHGKYSGSMKTTTHMDHISHCKLASGSNRSREAKGTRGNTLHFVSLLVPISFRSDQWW